MGPSPWLVGLVVAVAVAAMAFSVVRAATPQGARESISTAELKRHVAFLASDTLEGRASGSQGGRAAAAYLAHELRQAGLKPGGEGGDFLQLFQQDAHNLLALLPGSDPELADEVILISGHFDHVGFGSRGNSLGPYGQIHNGADDNASGTAAVVEIAAALASLDVPPRRTLLFALWDAEEGGMIGSKHWLKNPTVPQDRIRLMVNCDMVGRLRNDVLVVYGVRTAAGLRQRVSEANWTAHREAGLRFNFDWRQRDDSDHWPFYQRGIPYLMLHTGDHLDYHRPSDDADKVNYEGLEAVSRLLFELARSVADADVLPGFREMSRNERPPQQRQAEAVAPPPASRLGLTWDGNRLAGAPFVVTAVEPQSPAERAGLRAGDRIVRFAEIPVSEIDRLSDFVLALPAVTTATVERVGQQSPLTLPIRLRGEPVRLGVQWRTDDAEPGVAIVTAVIRGSPAAAAGIEPLDRLLPPAHQETDSTQWLEGFAGQPEVTLRRERRGRVSAVTLQPLRMPLSASPPAEKGAD